MTAGATGVIHRQLAGGTREVAGFFGQFEERLFGVTHLPAMEPARGLVVCSSVGPEQITNYRNEVLLARRLAAAGWAVQRVHYRGTGHSHAADAALTLKTMAEDTVAAVDRLAEVSGVRQPVLLGTRWGAFAAIDVSSRVPAAPLVFWEPVVDAPRGFRELFRAQFSHELRIGHAGGRTTEAMVAELQTSGVVDVLGYSLHRGFYESAIRTRSLEQLSGPRPIYVIRLGQRTDGEAGLAPLRAAAAAAGCAIDVIVLPQAPVWHFVNHAGDWDAVLVQTTVDWLLSQARAHDRGEGT